MILLSRAKVNRPLRLRILELLAQRSEMTFTDVRVAITPDFPNNGRNRGGLYLTLEKLHVMGAVKKKPIKRRDDNLCHHTYSLSSLGYKFIDKYRKQIIEEGQEMGY